MPYVAGPFVGPHLYLQWSGELPGLEQWSCGLRMSPVGTGPWPLTDAASLITGATTAIKAFHARVGSQISNYCQLSSVKLNPIDVDGHYALGSTNEQVFTAVGGVGTANRYPNQIALVASLRTGVSRGPAHGGRFYLPMPSMALGTDGLISTTDRNSVKTSLATLLTDLNALSTAYKVAVHSRKLGAPAQRLVTLIDVGRVFDTQRRRRRSLGEAY